ncbi:hypothetical protein POM88_008162 [Heracleum sosnowskyi]|uniref:Uncharacterized protein n=1 Tax=Heracleum sosnowskyi TaxID=360622 RepID=A0AAD8N687_9APIA|nr:hypothetical protein POM88_008162 [Heracleum sosnowskyi]
MGIDPLTHRPLHAHPPMDIHQDHAAQFQERVLQEHVECQENDGISILLDDSIITDTDDHVTKVGMDTYSGVSIHEVPFIEPREILPNSGLQSSCSSNTYSTTSASAATSSMSTTNSILEDLKFLPSFEDWLSDGHSEVYIESTGFNYVDDSIDWDRLLNFDIDQIDDELIQSLPCPNTAQLWS